MNRAELKSVKALRALTDPVVIHGSCDDEHLPFERQLLRETRVARVIQNVRIPLENRIKHATWPETVIYLRSAGNPEEKTELGFDLALSTAIRECGFQRRSRELDQSQSMSAPHSDSATWIREKLDALRFGLKRTRDTQFVEQRFETLDIKTVQRSFWE